MSRCAPPPGPAAKGRKVAVVYDAHEYTAGDIRPEDATWTPVMFAQERKYIPAADGVVAAVEQLRRQARRAPRTDRAADGGP